MGNPEYCNPIPLLAGPTAVGKTAVSLHVARQLNAEILSADARQIYRGLTIGTAKPSAKYLSAVPHHFIDELEPHEPFSSGQFARAAERRIAEILERGRIPLVVGGSTLYIEALVRGFSDIPYIDPEIRQELNDRLGSEGAAALYAELRNVDPASARTMDQTKSQRIVRALEIYYGTGTPLSEFHSAHPSPAFQYAGVVLTRPREALYNRINARVDQMLADGLVAEVRSLMVEGTDPERNAFRTIGYREAVSHIRGTISHDEMVRLIKRNSRRYAKRQITWFKRYPTFTWLPATAARDEILEALQSQSAD
jgi:tRNA dimethylallyltransferase